MGSVDIIIGPRWREELRRLRAQRQRRPGGHVIELEALRDVVDLIIDERNLTSAISRERIFPFMTSLARALRRVGRGPHAKTFVECEDEPWELVWMLGPAGKLLLSIYSVGRDREVVCRDHPVTHAGVVRAVGQAGRALLEELEAIAPDLAQAPQAARLREALAALEADPAPHAPRAERREPRWRRGSTSLQEGLTLSYRYDANHLGLATFDRARPLDQHALLCPGALIIEREAADPIVCAPYPLLALRELLDRVDELARGARAPAIPSSHLRLEALAREPARWQLRLSAPGSDQAHMEMEVRPRECLDGVLTFARLMTEDVLEAHPDLGTNRRWRRTLERLEVLQGHLEAETPSTSASAPPPAPGAPGRPEPPAPSPTTGAGGSAPVVASAAGFPWPLSSVRALHPHIEWSWSEPGLAPERAVPAAHDVLLVPWERGLMGLDMRRGQERWRWEGGAIRRGALALHHDGKMALHQPASDELVALSVRRGEELARIELPPMHHLLEVASLPGERALLMGERGAVTALDLRQGRALWHVSGGSRGAASYAWGPSYVLRLQHGTLERLELGSGEPVWSARAGDHARALCVHQGRAVVISAGAQRAQTHVRSFELEHGARRQELSLDGYYLGPARSVGQDLWLIIERRRRPIIESLRGAQMLPAWIRPLREQPRALSPSLTLTTTQSGEPAVLVQTAASQRALVRARDGAILWSVDGTPLMRAPRPAALVRDGCLCLGEALELRLLEGGELVHRFDEFLDEPCYLQARGELDVLLGELPMDESPPTLMSLAFGHYLAVVE